MRDRADDGQVPLSELIRCLPDLPEYGLIRLCLRRRSRPVEIGGSEAPGAWADPVVDREGIGAAVEEMADELQTEVERLRTGYARVLRAAAADDGAAVALGLIALGDHEFERNRLDRARRFFDAALARARPLRDRGPEVRALLRVGRAAYRAGELEEALFHYRRSARLAADVEEAREEVTALTGAGNALAAMGRWAEAEDRYRQALSRAEAIAEERNVHRSQLLANLAMVAKNRGRLGEAEAWLEEADGLVDPARHRFEAGLRLHGLAEVRSRQYRFGEARALCARAVELQVPPYFRALFLDDLVKYCLAEGALAEARRWGREAEEAAIESRSPYALGAAYRGLGKIGQAEGNEEAWVFFEQALQLARETGHRNLEAEVLVDYALQREEIGEIDEAEAYRERAAEIFRGMGIVEEEVGRRLEGAALPRLEG